MNNRILTHFIIPFLLCFSVAQPTHANPVQEALRQATNIKANGAYLRQQFVALQKKTFDSDDNRPRLLLIGDSHALDFLNSGLENGYLSHYQIRTRYIPTRCQITLSPLALQKINLSDRSLCAKSDNLRQIREQIAQADVVILAARWHDWSAQALPSTIQALHLRPQQQLIVVGAKDFGKVTIPLYLKQPPATLKKLLNKVDPKPLAANQLLHHSLGAHIFVDPQPLICGGYKTCRLFTDSNQLISYDGGHLTQAGAKYVGQRLFRHPLLKKLETAN